MEDLHDTRDSSIAKSEIRLKKCEDWLEKLSLDGTDADDYDSPYSESNCSVFTETTDNSAMESGYRFENDGIVISDKVFSAPCDDKSLVLSTSKEKPKFEHINIYKSKKVHIGDVTYLNGPITIVNEEKRQSITCNNNLDYIIDVTRTNWLAQPPLAEKQYLKKPAKYVIIGHTATEEGFTVAENTLLVHLIQTFHIESRKWDDIAYNFLIGSDGLVYEGRGWGVVGSHTKCFNDMSIGICFIGCFLDHLPAPSALKKAQKLIQSGLKREYIDPQYLLRGHCQCSGVESPGKRLFQEIQTWQHWDGTGSNEEPSVVRENRRRVEGEYDSRAHLP